MILALLRLKRLQNLLRQFLAACAAVSPDRRLRELTAEISAVILYDLRFRLGVRDKGIQRDNRGNTELLHVLDVLAQVDDTLLQCFKVLLLQVCLRDAAVVLQRLDARDNDGRIGLQSRDAALDVQEFLCAEVRAEAGLRDAVICHLQCSAGRADGVAAMCDIRERSAVHQSRRVLDGLHQIRLQRRDQQRGHRARRAELFRAHRLSVVVVSDDDAVNSAL